MNNNMLPVIKTAVLVVLAVVFQYLLRNWDLMFSSAIVSAALMVGLRHLGLRSAIVAAILIPWMSAVPQIMHRVLTYPMFFANLAYVLLFHGMTKQHSKIPFAALPVAAFVRAFILHFMVVIVIGTWLEPHLQNIGAVNHGRITGMFNTLAPWRQVCAALLGGGTVLAVPHLKTKLQPKS